MGLKRIWMAVVVLGIAVSAHALDLNQVESDWCNDRISSKDAGGLFRQIAWNKDLPAEDRLKADLYSMLCSAQCYDIIDTREMFRSLDAATTQTSHKLLMDYVRIDLEGRDGPRDEAIKALEVMLYENPNVPFAHPIMASLARFNLDAGRATEGFRWQDTILADYPTTSHTMILRTGNYVQQTRIDKLNELYEQAKSLAADPQNDPLCMYLKGFSLMFAGSDNEAITAMETALATAPVHPLHLLTRCKLSALYHEVEKDEQCIEMVNSFIMFLDRDVQFDPYCEASYYKLNRLWSMGRYREAIDTAFSMDVEGWNTDQRHRVEGIIAEFFRRAIDSIKAMGLEQSGLDADTIELLELRAQSAMEKLRAEIEVWRPVSVGYTLYYNQQYQELIDYCDWALENLNLSAYLYYRMLQFKATGYYGLATQASLEKAVPIFETIVNADEEAQRAINTLEWEFYLQERENLFSSAHSWLIQACLNIRRTDDARKYYDSLKATVPHGSTRDRMIRRFAPQVGDQ